MSGAKHIWSKNVGSKTYMEQKHIGRKEKKKKGI
jgi:hypothetical protein